MEMDVLSAARDLINSQMKMFIMMESENSPQMDQMH
jgi:hypothetical protein